MSEKQERQYDKACRFLDEAWKVDEAKDIADYLRVADSSLEVLSNAISIRLRGTRMVGKLMAEMEAEGKIRNEWERRKLFESVDIIDDQTQAKARRLASFPDDEWDVRIDAMRKHVMKGGSIAGAERIVTRDEPPMSVIVDRMFKNGFED
jgi:hypothetical protein